MAGGELMSKHAFRSLHAITLKAFIEVQRLRGYTYNHQSDLLRRFDRYLCERTYRCPWLEHTLVDDYLVQFSGATAYSQSTMLSVIRGYSRFLHLRYPQSYVLPMPLIRAKRPSRVYLYSSEEVSALIQAASDLGPPGAIGPCTVKTVIGLLYVSGLRISEALALNVEDLDVPERVLFVRKGKFGKDRYVPLASSSVDALLRYRRKAEKISKDQALFISNKGTRFNATTMGNLFRRLLQECGIASCKPWPRLHDLRHTFAVNCLCQWYDQGCDVNALLPVLSTVMGHVKVSCTQIYLHVPVQLREQGANRFRNHVKTRIIPER
jgi:integrase